MVAGNERCRSAFDDRRLHCPSEGMSADWESAFLLRLNAMAGGTPHCQPTEARRKWEALGDDGAAAVPRTGKRSRPTARVLARPRTRSVGGSQVGRMHDMPETVWKMMVCWFGDYREGTVTDPVSPPNGPLHGSPLRVVRGGSWRERTNRISATMQSTHDLDIGVGLPRIGLRLASGLPDSGARPAVEPGRLQNGGR